ncbi:MAG: hypothetical protein JPMHGGIA_01375 [Saprospiraceae bacterium]|jgi:hypothetical protein|nr:hypothetical protein [Saprospiraceae bacterium]
MNYGSRTNCSNLTDGSSDGRTRFVDQDPRRRELNSRFKPYLYIRTNHIL